MLLTCVYIRRYDFLLLSVAAVLFALPGNPDKNDLPTFRRSKYGFSFVFRIVRAIIVGAKANKTGQPGISDRVIKILLRKR